ncbi:PACE efflux transporter [Vibrio lentus]
MSHKERMLHMVLFELAALILMAVAATYIVGGGAVKMAGLALSLSLIAMTWNYVYNYGYDKIYGADRSKRTKGTRILHGLGFELGLMLVTFPLLMWVLQLDFWTVLGRVDLCCTFRVQQYIGSHINMNASDNMLA